MLAQSCGARAWAVTAAGVLAMFATLARAEEAAAQPRDLLVLAAASLTDAFGEIGEAFERETGQRVTFSFAASALLARQVEAGIRADVFVSADEEWMDYLERRRLVAASSRRTVAGNRLVLIAPASSSIRLSVAPGFPLADALGGGRLATGDPDFVPVGRYARAALMHLAVWDEVDDRLARAENARAALAFVARGEAPVGIVYATDAAAEQRVRVVARFPTGSHPPILYPAAMLAGARPESLKFLQYLASDAVQTVLTRHGFAASRQ